MPVTATKSRIAPMYYDTPPRVLPDLPKTPAERREALADAVFASVLALQGLLTDKDPKVVIQAAGMILDVDKTQMRHSSHVSGTADPSPLGPLDSDWGSPMKQTPQPAPASMPQEKMARMDGVADADDDFEELDLREPKSANVADPMVAFIERMRKVLQEEADEKGTGEVVSWARAESVGRQYLAYKERQQANAEATRPPSTPHRE